MTAFDDGVRDGLAKTAAGSRAEAAREVLGLGLIAAPVAHGMVQKARGKKLTHGQEQAHAVSDLAGLGLLASPYIKSLVKRAATSGETERETSAPGVTGGSWQAPDAERRAEPEARRRGRGPDWLRALKGRGTWSS